MVGYFLCEDQGKERKGVSPRAYFVSLLSMVLTGEMVVSIIAILLQWENVFLVKAVGIALFLYSIFAVLDLSTSMFTREETRERPLLLTWDEESQKSWRGDQVAEGGGLESR